jgi:hypothetical protein
MQKLVRHRHAPVPLGHKLPPGLIVPGLRHGGRSNSRAEYLPIPLTFRAADLFFKSEVPDFHVATVADIFDGLVAAGAIHPSHLGFYYLAHGWFQVCPAPAAASLSDLGIHQHSTLTLCGRTRGGTKRRQTGEFLRSQSSPSVLTTTPPLLQDENDPPPSSGPSHPRQTTVPTNVLQPSNQPHLPGRRNPTRSSKSNHLFFPDQSAVDANPRKHPRSPSPSSEDLFSDTPFSSEDDRAPPQKRCKTSRSDQRASHTTTRTCSRPVRVARSRKPTQTQTQPQASVSMDTSPDPADGKMTTQRSLEKGRETSNPSQPQCSSDANIASASTGPDVSPADRPPTTTKSQESGVKATEAASRKNAKNSSRVKIVEEGSGFTYEFDGIKCQHACPNPVTAGSPTPVPSSSSSTLSPQTPTIRECRFSAEDMDNSCAGLHAHSISKFDPMDAFFCHLHNDFIPFEALKQHIRIRHANTLPYRPGHVASFFTHLNTFYPRVAECKPVARSTTHFSIPGPISFLPAPNLYGFCPSESCAAVFKWGSTVPGVNKAYAQHVSNSPECKASLSFKSKHRRDVNGKIDWKAVDITLKYAQVTGTYGGARCVFYLPNDWTPPLTGIGPSQSSLSKETKPSSEKSGSTGESKHQPYITELGWDKAFPPQHILAFKSLLKMPLGEDPSAEEVALERGVSEIRDLLYDYLESANRFVEGRCVMVRQAITKG